MKRPDFQAVKRRLQDVLSNNIWLREFTVTLAAHVAAGLLVAEIVR